VVSKTTSVRGTTANENTAGRSVRGVEFSLIGGLSGLLSLVFPPTGIKTILSKRRRKRLKDQWS